jgi:S1-C subfamily serine protease
VSALTEDPVGLLRDLAAPLLGADLTGFDLLLLALLVLAVLSGLRAGLVGRATRLAGLALGLLAVGSTVPLALGAIDPPTLTLRAGLAAVVVGATVLAVSAAVAAITAPLRALLRLGPLSLIDRTAGAVASGVAAVLLAWLLIPAAAAVPGRVSAEVRTSAVLGAVDAALPPQPDVTRSLRALAGLAGFPEPFVDLAPTPAPVAPPPDPAELAGSRAEAAGLSAATWVHAVGCGRLQSGSGFAIDPDHVVTNAHVVAGGRELSIGGPDGGELAAVVVVLDPGRDLALLSVPGHGLAPLTPAEARVGDLAVVVGHPGGSLVPRVAPARVERRVLGVGRDIYGDDGAERDLAFLAADLRRGDSGAPVVGADGTLLGVVFAISPDEPSVAYAVTADEVTELLALPRAPGESGPCI